MKFTGSIYSTIAVLLLLNYFTDALGDTGLK